MAKIRPVLYQRIEGRRPSDISKRLGGERKRNGKRGKREEEKREEGITVSRC
jgi:hypothetical protein